MARGASQPRSAESVEQLGGAVMREATPSLRDQKAWPTVLDRTSHETDHVGGEMTSTTYGEVRRPRAVVVVE